MRDFHAFRSSAVRYWERRRIIYNVALVLPALFGYAFTDSLNWVGDPHRTHYSYIIALFLVSAAGANICYSFSYLREEVRVLKEHLRSKRLRFTNKQRE